MTAEERLESTKRQLSATEEHLRIVALALQKVLESNPSSPSSKRRRSWPQPGRQGRRQSLRLRNKQTQTSPLASPVKSPGGSKPSTKKPDSAHQKDVFRIAKSWKAHSSLVTKSESRGLSRFDKNYCYRTSLLQCLLHQPAFFQYLRASHDKADHDSEDDKDTCLVCATQDLSAEYWKTTHRRQYQTRELEGATSRLNDVIERIVGESGGTAYDDLVDGRQNDPFVLLQFLMEQFKSAEIDGKTKRLLGELLHDEGEVENWPPLTMAELFDIEQRREWRCGDCGHLTTITPVPGEEGHGVGLPVNLQEPERCLTLVEYLQHNVFEETMEIRCEDGKCSNKKSASKERVRCKIITKAPEILVLQLTRTAQEPMKNGKGKFETFKIEDLVPTGEYLNLGEFTDSDAPLLYRLDSVVAHRSAKPTKRSKAGDASTIHGGHYIAAVREQSGRSFCVLDDDEPVARNKRGSFQELCDPKSQRRNFDPYLLFYSKIHKSSPRSEDGDCPIPCCS